LVFGRKAWFYSVFDQGRFCGISAGDPA
jgi:hypothetical protein